MAAATLDATPQVDALDRLLIDLLQQGIAVDARPFRAPASLAGIDEAELIERVGRMLDRGVLTRFGPMYNADRMGGAFTLAAMAVPAADFERVAALVNAHPEVAHNYEREHALNMWFVVATETPERIGEVLAAIGAETGLEVLDFPKETEYYVGLKFDLTTGAAA